MNVLRKYMADEAERLKPLLDRAYSSILSFQETRTSDAEQRLREAFAPAIDQLMIFKPYMPAYKQEYFDALASEWRALPAGQAIMLFDHCVDIMHLRLARRMSVNEYERAWTRELTELLDRRRAGTSGTPVEGDFLCSGTAASPGRAVGPARVMTRRPELADLRAGEILVCRMATPDWVSRLTDVRAIVTDEGGALCHAAILAREFSLPCVTGCHNATEVIRTGDCVEVNGDFGIVTKV